MNPEPDSPAPYELPRGTVVGKYEIMRKIAAGGMAEIYLARITGAAGFEKVMVLKRILPTVSDDPAFVQMFFDEARLAATLRHPNIADVYDVGVADGIYFFTMEFVHGQDVRSIRLETRKREETVPVSVALAIVHGTALALDHAHAKTGSDGKPLGIVHRDVSASNIVVSYDGAVKLLDFGIARAASSKHKTQVGTLKGKVPYMSPEQCRALPLDRRSDLFSLGVVMYELTVGRRPFRGESDFEIMDQIVYKGAPAPSMLVPGYPPDLEAMVMKLLEGTPEKRYATGEEFLVDLDAFIAKHGLWMSPRAIGKYMRSLFADKIEAWERAQQEGVPFAQHVARVITSESKRFEALTPPSAVQAAREGMVPPGPRLSQPMAAFVPIEPIPQSTVMDAVEPPQPVAEDAQWDGENDETRKLGEDEDIDKVVQSMASGEPDEPIVSREQDARIDSDDRDARIRSDDRHSRIDEPAHASASEQPRRVSYPVMPAEPRSYAGIVLTVLVVLALVAGGVFAFMLLQQDLEATSLGPRTGGGPIDMMGAPSDAGTDDAPRAVKKKR